MKNNHKTIKSKCKSENDREARLAAVLGGSDSPDEVTLTLTLSRRCSSGARTSTWTARARARRRRATRS